MIDRRPSEPAPSESRCDLHVEEAGSGEPVLLVMGLGMPGAAWSAMVPALAEQYRVATFDHRGVGRSPDPARRSISALVDDAVSVLDHLGWPRAHLVGVSMGGMISQELTLRHPERVRTLTLIATHAGGLLAKIPTLRGILAFGTWDPQKRLERLLHPRDRRPGLRPATRVRRGRGTLLAHLRAVRGHDCRTRIGGLRVPTLVMKPARDILIRPSANDWLAAAIPGARLEVFPRAGHGLVVHDADIAVSLLIEHIEAHPMG